MAAVDLSLAQYSEEKGRTFFSELLNKLNAMPGVVSASLAGSVPPTEWPGAVSIFRTLGIPLPQGRDFTSHDRTGAPGVVIVSRKLAEKMWPGDNLIGNQISYPRWQGPGRPPFEVIGVAADVKHLALTSEAPLLLYVPIFQEFAGHALVVVRTVSDPYAGVVEIQRALSATDKRVAASMAQTGPEHSFDSLWQQRLAAEWIGAFSVMALVLAAVGLYTVAAQSAAQRTREIGIRLALGARPAEVIKKVVVGSMGAVLVGAALGLVIAFAGTGMLSALLFGVAPRDPFVILTVTGVLLSAAAAAALLAARGAARVAPLLAMRIDQ